MAVQKLTLVGGPDKPALQWALSYPKSEVVEFRTEDDAMDVEVQRMDELADGFSFDIEGVLRSGAHKGRPCKATYSVEQRRGTLTVDTDAPPI